MRTCIKCSTVISAKRIEALPHTKVCIQCSDVKPLRGHMITPHKTGSHIQIISEQQHQYIQSVNHRRGYGANLPTDNKRVS